MVQIAQFLSLTIGLALLWAALNASFSVPNLILGTVMALVSIFVIGGNIITGHSAQLFRILYRPLAFLRLVLVFVRELLKAALQISVMMLTPKSRWQYHPGILAVPLDAKSDFSITTFANLITLVPGTLAIDVSEDKQTLYMHVLDATDPLDQQIDDIDLGKQRIAVKQDFETNVIRAFGGG